MMLSVAFLDERLKKLEKDVESFERLASQRSFSKVLHLFHPSRQHPDPEGVTRGLLRAQLSEAIARPPPPPQLPYCVPTTAPVPAPIPATTSFCGEAPLCMGTSSCNNNRRKQEEVAKASKMDRSRRNRCRTLHTHFHTHKQRSPAQAALANEQQSRGWCCSSAIPAAVVHERRWIPC